MTAAGDLVLGLATMSRLGSAALRTPGTASDVLPLRVTAAPDTSVAELARAVADELTALRRHQRYRGEFLRRDLGLLGTGRRLYGPVLNIVPFDESPVFGGHPTTWHHLSGGAVDDLQISVRPGGLSGGLWLAFDANPALYDEDELALHRDRFLTVLRRLAEAAPATPLGDLDVLLPGEHPRDAPVRTFPVERTLTELFEERAADGPERTAVTCGDERLTYAALDAEANRLARLLVDRGAGPGRVVALALDRGSGCCPPCWPSSRRARPTCRWTPDIRRSGCGWWSRTRPPSCWSPSAPTSTSPGTRFPSSAWTTRGSRRIWPAAPPPTSPTPTGSGR